MKNKTNQRTQRIAWRSVACLVLALMCVCIAPITGIGEANVSDLPLIVEGGPGQQQAQPEGEPIPSAEVPGVPDAGMLPTPQIVETTPMPRYRVTFYDMYGNVYASADVPEGNYVIEPPKPVMPGYTFHYWYDEAAELLEPYPFGEAVTRDINLWPMLTLAQPNGTPENNPAGQDENAGALEGGKTTEEIAQEIIQGGNEQAVITPVPGNMPEVPPEMIPNLIEEILQTPQPDLETPSPLTAEGILASVTDEPILAPEATDQPLDARAIIAEIIGSDHENQEPNNPTATPDAVASGQVQGSAAPIQGGSVNVQKIEAILQSPAPPSESSPGPTTISAPPIGTQEVIADETQPPVTALPGGLPTPEMQTDIHPEETESTTDGKASDGMTTEKPIPEETTDIPDMIDGQAPAPDNSSSPEGEALISDDQQEDVAIADTAEKYHATVSIFSQSDDEFIELGSTVTLVSQIDGIPAGAMVAYQWQNDISGQYKNVAGATGSTYTYVVDKTNNNCDWRLQVQIITQ